MLVRGKHLIVTMLAGAALLLVGCNSKVDREHYDRIKTGMTQSEVESVLGKGKVHGGDVSVGEVSLSATTIRWSDGDKQITVVFTDGRVVMKQQRGL